MTYSVDLTNASECTAPYYWGIDIGGTGIKLGLVDDQGHTVAFESIPTREAEGPQTAVNRVCELIHSYESELDVVGCVPGIGLGAPGPMDLHKGTLVEPPQLPSWWSFPLVDAFFKRLDRPVAFLNDANAAAYGEFWLGSGKTHSSMLLLTLGTGVGGGIIVDHELVNGVNSFGSECGHIVVDPSPTARLCGWGGGRGQLEAYASATGLVMRTRERLTEGAQSSLAGLLGGANTELTAKRVYEAACDGDVLANELIDETAKWLGIGITTLVHTLDTGSVVLGGAMNFGGSDSEIGQRFLAVARTEFRSRTFDNVYEGTTLQFATLGSSAGYLGLAGYARHQAKKKANH